ncbi:asparagine--tRNA ligase [Candidatus Micrarchaeota archaeon]|nr:asparagine--tRNA ligase [Candidatus Micrarchaeota archaeon]
MIVHISEIFSKKMENKEVTVRGWIYRHRTSGNMVFAVLRDGSGIIQATVKKDKVDEKSWNESNEVYVESSAIISGKVVKDERAPGGYELKVSKFETVYKGEPFPISKDLSDEFLLDVRHLWLRSQKLTKIFEGRSHIVNYLREFFSKEEFYELPPPILTKSACEGGSTLFELDYFGDKAYLSQSGQLYAEAYIYSLEKVYVLAPSFRAEKSRTIRHLAEYWHLEPEMAWYDHKMNMELQEKMVEYVAQKMVKNHPELLKEVGREPGELAKVKAPFKRIDYEKAVDMVNELGGKMKHGEDFGADEEAVLTKDFEKPVFVHHFPKEIKAFYMPEDPKKPGYVLCDDLLAPQGHGEIIGGSERIWKLDELMQRIEENNLNPKDYQWYIDLRKYGSVPHSGFGLGIERLVKYFLNLDHIRDTIPFPRTITRCYP